MSTALEKLEEAVFLHLDEAEKECAALIEQAHADAIKIAELRIEAAKKEGADQMLKQVLLLISFQLEQLKEGGTNALALHQLRDKILDQSATTELF